MDHYKYAAFYMAHSQTEKEKFEASLILSLYHRPLNLIVSV